ncbi:DUF6083 domain-containing protein [Streptomyces sp. RK62]|uniref:DUF6083 domain-containing protein n=1 Tax=Streptomyces sp. RK62 TaxID=2824893 RepID=UPI001B39881D|nr:DUF6083 domain-containing protein [Streptomyces sp. RK62]MBQ0997479.1 hypothetical protein [Streptomyces sp. RK62]
MHSTSPAPRHRDGTPTPARRTRRSLQVTPGSVSRLLRCGQSGRCRDCGNPIEWYHRSDQRLVRLHPHELPAVQVPDACRWHVSSGVAHPAGDGSSWCRLAHAVLCPARDTPPPSQLAGLRRSLGVHSRRLIDAGVFTPPPASPPRRAPEPVVCRPARPIVQMLYVRYLSARPVDEIQCVAQTRHRHRCTSPLLTSGIPGGTWMLMPTAESGQLALPTDVMAVYNLSRLPYAEQLRWRAQRCRQHAASSTAADLAVAEWEPFDPLRHHQHIHTRLPGAGRRPGAAGRARQGAQP